MSWPGQEMFGQSGGPAKRPRVEDSMFGASDMTQASLASMAAMGGIPPGRSGGGAPPAGSGGIPAAGSGGAAAPSDPSKELCWFHERGWCTKGDSCKFSHDLRLSKGLAPQAKAGAAAGASSDDLAQATLAYQQAVAGLQSDTSAQDSMAIVPAQDATAASMGYDEQTIAALYQYQALQATLMAQGGGGTDYGDPYGSAGGMDAATNAAYSAAWAAALSNAGLLPSTASALSGATSTAGAETDGAISAAAAAAAQIQQMMLLVASQGGSGGEGLAGLTTSTGADPAAAAVAGVATTRANYKMQLCRFFGEGKCVKGAFCPYAHGNEEVLAASLRAARVEAAMREGSRNDVCYDFRDRGKCRFGITCKFSHNLSA